MKRSDRVKPAFGPPRIKKTPRNMKETHAALLLFCTGVSVRNRDPSSYIKKKGESRVSPHFSAL